MEEASQSDIRVIWDVLETDGEFIVKQEDDTHLEEFLNWEIVKKTNGEGGWTRLTEIMSLSKEEWAAAHKEEWAANSYQPGEIGDDSEASETESEGGEGGEEDDALEAGEDV